MAPLRPSIIRAFTALVIPAALAAVSTVVGPSTAFSATSFHDARASRHALIETRLPFPPPDSTLLGDVELYFATDTSHVSVPVSLGGLAPLWLDVDLGAEMGLLWPAARKALGERAAGMGGTMVEGYGGQVPAEIVLVDTTRLGNLVRTSAQYLVIDLETQMHITPSKTHPISGLVGRDLLRKYDLAFDFPAHRLRIYAPTDSAQGLERIKGMACVANLMQDRTEMIVVPVTVNGHKTAGFLDTGARLTTMDWELAQQVGITPDSKGVAPVKEWSGGVGGEIKEYTVPDIHISMGSIPLRDRELRFGKEIMPTAASLGDDQPHLILALNSINDRVLFVSTSTNQVCLGPRVTK